MSDRLKELHREAFGAGVPVSGSGLRVPVIGDISVIRGSTPQLTERTHRERDSGHRPPLQQNPNQKRSGLIRFNPTKMFSENSIPTTKAQRARSAKPANRTSWILRN